ncbi:MAG: toxin-antitoxin system YwqK family antitoxin [Helicobacteraceae bacterium]|jgi:antitoxin component YwqK of YwqJK toxin-antitoxin module|nr:toxin-antitoxin system YwqK family antitoxin [Helicobacteraceae bacterium]
MKKILIAILLAAVCQSANADYENADYKVYVDGKTARFYKGNCLDMKGNLLSGKAEVRDTLKDGTMFGTSCIDGKESGTRAYYKSGALKFEIAPKDANTEEMRSYYESGALENIIPYKNGKSEGIVKGFYESGKLKSEMPYKNGDRDGISKVYYENGRLKEEIPMDGIGKIYYEDGNLEKEIAFKNGTKEGEMKVLRKNGTTWGIFTYKNDKAISGVCHLTNGQKAPFTEAELENWNNGFKINCE